MKIIKRNGSEAVFDISKIIAAVSKANNVVPAGQRLTKEQILQIADEVQAVCSGRNHAMNVEEIQDLVENAIMGSGAHEVARKYITYRYVQGLKRTHNTTDDRILSLIECNNEEVKQENSNKNPTVNSVQRDYMAGEVSKDLTMRMLLPPEVVKAHEEGIIHFHDADYFAQHMHNCDLVNLDDMLQNGTVISGTLIEKPHSFSTACNIATQIIAQVASNQYGGQSISLTHLAPFVDISRKKIRRDVEAEMVQLGIQPGEEKIAQIVETRLREEIKRGVQTIQYQVVTLMTTNGQAPFITVFMYLGEAGDDQRLKSDLAIIIEEMLRQRYQGVKNEAGVWITPAFPKLIYVLEEDNIREGTPYFYLTKLAAKCTAKRMVPDYISEKKMREYKLSKGETEGHGDVYTCMGCRSFLTPDRSGNGWDNIANAKNYDGKPKYYGRFNQGVVTINLVDVALSSGGDFDKFWKVFDERLDLCHTALMCRHNRLKGTLSDAAPILWQYGALARLKKGEPIDKLLYGGYSTISLGYAGLYECCKYMTGKSHTDPAAKPFALQVMQHMNDACAKWKAESNIDFSLYGTPLESTTYKFAKCLQKRFGIVPGITDRNYITNSYHVHVSEQIDAFTKLKFESDFQKLSPGGAISYVEVPNMQDNLAAVIRVMQFIYDNIMYAELNTKSDYCQVCGFDGEIRIVEDDGKLVWECPHCHNRDQNKLNVARRTCGYIGTQFWNQGRTAEIKDRVLHL
ncbi:MAG TPA: anaerobic ribonucleoside-triphosphate reductase [Candidatus Gemmiger stercoravium]|uniref:anaerobic ribonucleoside-triphosphate reductase n=1 Tax=uncultured Subdoligranulum sp. TaxID=512298 RepID=UPI001F9099D6|nr:anaerobic ribonucleoside-triphosphate reductase [uncultured Subdoligranulum sp.]HJC55070.1 anaerobic ribonucleoside-triphosphate reductase [Candidatus Gemmiger stercoravium]